MQLGLCGHIADGAGSRGSTSRRAVWLDVCEPGDMRLWSGFLCAVVLAALVGACSGNTIAQTTGPSPVKCQPSLAGVPTSVPSSGASVTATISTTRDCTWNVTTDASWVQVNPSAGQGAASITVVVAPNSVTSSRSATISVNGATVSLSEAAAPLPPPPPPPPSGTPISFSGQVSNLSGSCPTLAFVVAGRPVRTNSQTQFVPGNCGNVVNGVNVTISGQLLTSGIVQATQVNVKKK